MVEADSFSKDDIDALIEHCRKGDITKSPKADLERYAAMVCSRAARGHRSSLEFMQLSDTIRTLLIVRMSEQANEEATRISKVALWIAMAALGGTLLQVLLPLWHR